VLTIFIHNLKHIIMARARNNATDRASGKVDQFVYRSRKDKTVMAKKPDKSRKPPTQKQEDVRDRFRLAALYARQAMNDPALKAFYASKATYGKGAYNMAFADYLDAPRIKDIITSGYSGSIGDKIAVIAIDSFKVKAVRVKITRADGTLVEQGEAVQGTLSWEYSCTVNNASLTGCIIMVTAYDLPGNSTVEQKPL
jgi:hypothetical protein